LKNVKNRLSFPKVSGDIVDFDESVLKILKKGIANRSPKIGFNLPMNLTQALNGEIEIEDIDTRFKKLSLIIGMIRK
jgi:hypothetical protein